MSHSLVVVNANLLRAGWRIAIFGVLISFALPAASAQAASPAEAFVQSNINEGFAILNNDSLSRDEKNAQFRTFLLSLTDLNYIADYTLGPAKNKVSPADLAEFEQAFREYAVALYESEFDKYSGQTLRVIGSAPRGDNEWIVRTQLVDPNARPNRQPIEVDFRVFGKPGSFVVGDVTVLGVDLAIAAQGQFEDFLLQHNDDVKALTADILRRAAKMRAGDSIKGS
jgi:phospholipid transport system substrate-binding protein